MPQSGNFGFERRIEATFEKGRVNRHGVLRQPYRKEESIGTPYLGSHRGNLTKGRVSGNSYWGNLYEKEESIGTASRVGTLTSYRGRTHTGSTQQTHSSQTWCTHRCSMLNITKPAHAQIFRTLNNRVDDTGLPMHAQQRQHETTTTTA